MSFDLEFSLFWVSRLFDLRDLSYLEKSPGNVFKKYIFEISGFHQSKWTVECAICLILILKPAQARGAKNLLAFVGECVSTSAVGAQPIELQDVTFYSLHPQILRV